MFAKYVPMTRSAHANRNLEINSVNVPYLELPEKTAIFQPQKYLSFKYTVFTIIILQTRSSRIIVELIVSAE